MDKFMEFIVTCIDLYIDAYIKLSFGVLWNRSLCHIYDYKIDRAGRGMDELRSIEVYLDCI